VVEMNGETPVLIAGGGPGGLAASICLSDLGVPSMLVEQHTTTTTHPKATVVNTRTFELFRHWGIEEEVRAGGLPLDRSRHILWATTLTGYELGRLDLTTGRSREGGEDDGAARRRLGKLSPTMTSICPQDVYEPILRRRAEAAGNAEVRFGCELVSFRDESRRVEAVVRDAVSGREERVRAHYLLACDGAASPVRDRLRTGAPRRLPDRRRARRHGLSRRAAGAALGGQRPTLLARLRDNSRSQQRPSFAGLIRRLLGKRETFPAAGQPSILRAHRFWATNP
jgi:2-polyprenyl-6-methoxyphenol hydroxylase-like FAD-dependent oxidoreductase